MKPSKLSLGQYGEELACKFLKSHHYQILERNYRTRYGEIDIIAKDDDIFIFVEVKTKTSNLFGQPEEMVGSKKKAKLVKLAKAYLQEKSLSSEAKNFQIDIISVMMEKDKALRIKHIKNITQYDN